jgi:predicted transcriptional regulator
MVRVTSVRLNDQTAKELDELAVAMDRPRSWLIEQAIRRYVGEEAWQVKAIAEALAEYRAGTAVLYDHDEVVAQIEADLRMKVGDESSLG